MDNNTAQTMTLLKSSSDWSIQSKELRKKFALLTIAQLDKKRKDIIALIQKREPKKYVL